MSEEILAWCLRPLCPACNHIMYHFSGRWICDDCGASVRAGAEPASLEATGATMLAAWASIYLAPGVFGAPVGEVEP